MNKIRYRTPNDGHRLIIDQEKVLHDESDRTEQMCQEGKKKHDRGEIGDEDLRRLEAESIKAHQKWHDFLQKHSDVLVAQRM